LKGDAEMLQIFQLYRLAIAFVLSVVLVLGGVQLTQAKTSQNPVYPSQAQAEEAISQYYMHGSTFSGKNTILRFDIFTYKSAYRVLKPSYSNFEDQKKFDGFIEVRRFDVCAQYQFTSVAFPVAGQTARHIFTLEGSSSTGIWNGIGMSLQSC
jgi:hypothetical protein